VRSKGVGPSLAVLFLVNTLNIYDRQALGAVYEQVRREFGLSDAQLGAIPTLFTIVYALAGLPLGRLADTGSRRRLLALGVTVWAGLTGLGALAVNYAMLVATRLGVGVGEASCAPASVSWIGDLVPPERRARAMARFMMAVPVGVMLSFAVTGPLAQAYGWRIAMACAALPALVLVPLILWLNEPERDGASRVTGRPGRHPIWNVLRVPGFGWIIASGAIVNFALYSFSTFISAFLTRYHGLTVGEAGVWAGLGSGIGGILGAVAAGAFGDRVISKNGAAGRLLLAAGAALAASFAALGGIGSPRGAVAAAAGLLMLGYGLLQMYYGLVYAAIQDLVEPHSRGSAMAVYYMCMYLCGGASGPVITGALSDWFARRAGGGEPGRAAGLHHALYLVPVMSLVLALSLWAAARATRARAPRAA
jgi:predicted MFS family arabinose efflux permease